MAKRATRNKVTLDGELMFPNDYMAAVEFKGRDVTLTIAAVSKESLQMTDGGKKAKMVLRFKETMKKLVCNKTNADSIAQMYQTKAEAWVGKRITLYPTKCLAFGDMVECVRIREAAPAANGSAPKAPPAPDAPPESSEGGSEFVSSLGENPLGDHLDQSGAQTSPDASQVTVRRNEPKP